MKKLQVLIASMVLCLLQGFAQYGPNWMSQVKSWDLDIFLEYKDSANPGNYTRIQFRAKGTITNEVLPAGSRMSWPLPATPDPKLMQQLTARGSFEKKVTEDAPAASRVEEFTCSGAIDEKIAGALAITLNNQYGINVQMPLIPQISCTGKGAPEDLKTLSRNEPIDPAESSPVLSGNTGSDRHTLSGQAQYTTESGARVKISWACEPRSGN